MVFRESKKKKRAHCFKHPTYKSAYLWTFLTIILLFAAISALGYPAPLSGIIALVAIACGIKAYSLYGFNIRSGHELTISGTSVTLTVCIHGGARSERACLRISELRRIEYLAGEDRIVFRGSVEDSRGVVFDDFETEDVFEPNVLDYLKKNGYTVHYV